MSFDTKPKRPLNPKIAFMNVERLAIYEEMKGGFKDPNAPKRPLNPKIVALNEERKKVFAEMQASYFEANPSCSCEKVVAERE
jgi:hypothetical protein